MTRFRYTIWDQLATSHTIVRAPVGLKELDGIGKPENVGCRLSLGKTREYVAILARHISKEPIPVDTQPDEPATAHAIERLNSPSLK